MYKCKLPQELIDIIIDNLDNDSRVLRGCALVCRSWLPVARRMIFHKVVLWPPNARYNKRPTDISYSIRLDRALISSPPIANYIQELRVYEGQLLRNQDWIEADPTLPLLLPKLTSLKRIELRRLEWTTVPTDLRRSLCGVLELPSLTSVEIEKASFDNIDDLASLLCCAKGLTNFSLIGTYIGNTTPPMHKDEGREEKAEESGLRSRVQRHFVSLRLGLASSHTMFIDWLLGPRSPWDVSHIHTLEILDSHQADTPASNRLLHAIGNSLGQLKLRVPWNMSNTGGEFHFGSNMGIKFLHLTNIIRSANPIPWLLGFFSNIGESNRLEEIKLEVHIPDGRSVLLDWSDWEEVDHVLAGAHFESLRKLDIELLPMGNSSPDSFDRTCRDLVRVLQSIKARGVSVNAY